MENVTSTMKACGSLEGLLLTGLTNEGIDLLETYISKVFMLIVACVQLQSGIDKFIRIIFN